MCWSRLPATSAVQSIDEAALADIMPRLGDPLLEVGGLRTLGVGPTRGTEAERPEAILGLRGRLSCLR